MNGKGICFCLVALGSRMSKHHRRFVGWTICHADFNVCTSPVILKQTSPVAVSYYGMVLISSLESIILYLFLFASWLACLVCVLCCKIFEDDQAPSLSKINDMFVHKPKSRPIKPAKLQVRKDID